MVTLTLLLRQFQFLLVAKVQNCICKSTPYGQLFIYAPGKVEELPFQEELTNTTLQCAGKCLQNRKCKVANFHEETGLCHIFSSCYNETEDIDGWEILRVIDDKNTNFIGPPFTAHSVIEYAENDCRSPSLAVFTCSKITPGKSQDHCPISVFNNTWSDYNLSCTDQDTPQRSVTNCKDSPAQLRKKGDIIRAVMSDTFRKAVEKTRSA
ncbi:unnamed protein product [Mytilus coruscus]|uniref:Apple domain-containing protein n=1 Tax=Mytilus coruscus TaxID=42192 RepID=A0A6J8CSV0_MYTCO|nr:unnamed protein product [Mytilus coruscus]